VSLIFGLRSGNAVPLPDMTTPTAPTDGVKLFSSDIAGRSMLSTVNSGGLLEPLQPSWAFRSIGMWTASAGQVTINSAGNMGSVSATGTATARVPGSTNYCTATRRVGIVSGASAADIAQFRGASSYPYLWRATAAAGGGGFTTVFRFNISDAVLVATAHMFVGVIASAIATDVAPSTQTNLIGIGVDSGDTVLQLYAAGSSAQSRVSLGANFPANTVSTDVYELALFTPPSGTTIGYRVTRLNTGHVASGTISAAANLPSDTTRLYPQMFRSNGGTAAAVGFDFTHVYVETP